MKRMAILTAALGCMAMAPAPGLAQPMDAEANEVMIGDTLPGAFYMAPAGDGPHPALIVLGGSEGNDGSARRKAPDLLAEGYAVLGLPYYSPAYGPQPQKFPQLSRAFDAIPVDMVGTARDWLLAREDVDPDNIGIWGGSKGAEMALLAGSLMDGFAAIVAIVPSDVVWEGWGSGTVPGENSSFSWQGEPLPFVPYVEMQAEIAKYSDPNATARLRIPHDRGRHACPSCAVKARIKVEEIDEPVFVAGGDADNVWNSGEMAQAIAERRAEAGLVTVSMIFTDAGHNLSGDGTPTDWSQDVDLEAQKLIRPAMLEFLATHLKD